MSRNKTADLRVRIEELEQLLDAERQSYEALLAENTDLRAQVERLQARTRPRRRPVEHQESAWATLSNNPDRVRCPQCGRPHDCQSRITGEFVMCPRCDAVLAVRHLDGGLTELIAMEATYA